MLKIKDFLGFLFRKTKIGPVIMAVITYFSFTYMDILPSYNVASWLILGSLLFVFFKVPLQDKCFFKESIFFAGFFSVLDTLGLVTQKVMYSPSLSLFKELLRPGSILLFVGLFFLFFMLLKLFLPFIFHFEIKTGKSIIKSKKKLFFISMGLLLLFYLPYFLAYYPGILSYDSIEQFDMIIHGFTQISDHHPIMHTLFMALIYQVGMGFTHNVIFSVGLCSLAQMIMMAAIFSYVLVFLHERKVNDKIKLCVFLFYAILPIHGFYSITMWKDVLFGGFLLLLVMEIIKLMEKDGGKVSFSSTICLFFVSLGCVFFRNNGIYVLIMVFLFLLLFLFNKKRVSILFLLIICVFLVVKGPLFQIFNVEKSESVEYIGMPIQMIGRMAYKGVITRESEIRHLEALMPVQQMATAYDPEKSDGIKFSEYFHEEVFNENKKDYLKLWFELIARHPDIATESYFVSTLGYWYPTVSHWSIFNYIYDNDYGIHTKSLLPSLKPVLNTLTSKRIPILNLSYSIGFVFWALFFFGVLTIKKRGWKFILPYTPILGIWVTMMIASPAYAELRYVYGAITSFPLLVLMPTLPILKKEDKK